MRKTKSFRHTMKILFGIIIGLFLVAEITAIAGIFGLGNKTVNIVFHACLLMANIFIAVKGYKVMVERIVEPLVEMEEAVKSLAQGKLDAQVTYVSNNEIGSLAESFRKTLYGLNTMVEDLTYILREFSQGNFDVRSQHQEVYIGDFDVVLNELIHLVTVFSGTMRNIDQAAEQVSVGSNGLAVNSQDMAQGASDQAAAVQELLATVTEVTDQVLETTKTTDQAHDNAKIIGEQAQISKQKMMLLTRAMESIKDTSSEIEKIIVDIEEIASQTNLLSLNASIEAARAGEAGRGFAVVAGQIGKLAEDSASSAVTTKELIDKAIEEIKRGNEITEETAKSLNQVIDEMDKIVMAVANIRMASDKQALSMKEIENGVEQINAVVQNNSAAAEETSATSEELSAQAETLKELVDQFKLREG